MSDNYSSGYYFHLNNLLEHNITAINKDLNFDELCRNIFQQDRWKKQFGSENLVASSSLALEASRVRASYFK